MIKISENVEKNWVKLRKIDGNWWKLMKIDENCMKLIEIAGRWKLFAVSLAGEFWVDWHKRNSVKNWKKLCKIGQNCGKLNEIG